MKTETISVPNTENTFSFNAWLLFGALLIVYALLHWVQSTYTVTDNMYFQELGEQLAYERIEKILENKQRYAWVAYIFIPMILLLRVLYSCICLYSGVFFQGWKVSFKAIWRVALLADMVWFLPLLIRIVYFSTQSDYSLSDVGSFYPYSVLVFFNAKSLRFVPNLAKTN
jgi:hypothetical protein